MWCIRCLLNQLLIHLERRSALMGRSTFSFRHAVTYTAVIISSHLWLIWSDNKSMWVFSDKKHLKATKGWRCVCFGGVHDEGQDTGFDFVWSDYNRVSSVMPDSFENRKHFSMAHQVQSFHLSTWWRAHREHLERKGTFKKTSEGVLLHSKLPSQIFFFFTARWAW